MNHQLHSQARRLLSITAKPYVQQVRGVPTSAWRGAPAPPEHPRHRGGAAHRLPPLRKRAWSATAPGSGSSAGFAGRRKQLHGHHRRRTLAPGAQAQVRDPRPVPRVGHDRAGWRRGGGRGHCLALAPPLPRPRRCLPAPRGGRTAGGRRDLLPLVGDGPALPRLLREEAQRWQGQGVRSSAWRLGTGACRTRPRDASHRRPSTRGQERRCRG